jgi:hypothetical protein
MIWGKVQFFSLYKYNYFEDSLSRGLKKFDPSRLYCVSFILGIESYDD